MNQIIQFLSSGFSAVVPFVILLGILIFVHELGHFLVAKYFGVRVEVFSLGLGKKILKYKHGDTTYCLSLIPFGGYVKMFGDEIGSNISEEEKKYSFLHKPVRQRIGIVLAGPLMNFFFALLILIVIALAGEDVRGPVIGDVDPGSTAYSAGFRSGDKILKVGDQDVETWDQIQNAMTSQGQKETEFQVSREIGQQLDKVKATPILKENPNILSAQSKIAEIEGLSLNSRTAVVGVRGQSFADRSGIRTGDRIISINKHPIQYFRQLENLLISLQGQVLNLELERPTGDKTPSEKISLELKTKTFSSLDGLGLLNPELFLYKVMESSPAEKAGLKAGDLILKVGSKNTERWEDVLGEVRSYSGSGEISFEVDREGLKKAVSVSPQMTSQATLQGGEEKRYTVGIVPSIYYSSPSIVQLKAKTFGTAFQRGLQRTVEITEMTLLSFWRLIQNKISPKHIGGVISIGQVASETFKVGWVQFCQMMAIISVNLFIVNLLPIPILDGGHLVFYTIEALKGAPVSLRKMEIAQQVGLVVLMSLMVFALFNDFTRLLGN